jgi:CRP-like cAMP-binding protein
MMAPAPQADTDQAAKAFAQQLIDAAADLRLPDLFGTPPAGALYHMPDRHGVTTLVLRTSDLSEAQLVKLMRYRLAQYLAVQFVDLNMIYADRLEHEPLAGVYPQDVHVLSGATSTGEILCYSTVKAAPEAGSGLTLRDHERPLFPVEKVHGWGVYNRLRVLPDLPIAKIRELGRFVKNQQLHTFDELGARAPVEVGVALFRTLSGPLRLEVDAIICDLEEGVALQNLEFFHVPMVVIHGTTPYEAEASYFFPRYQYCVVYPMAALASDISRDMIARLDAVEAALEQPGKRGLLGLFALKRDTRAPKSTLEPAEGLSALQVERVPQTGVAMATRRQMLDLSEQLRRTHVFQGLSVAEATVLGTFMERQTAAEDETIVRQGERGDDLFLIETGQVDVRVGKDAERQETVATLGPGDFFGEIALLTGAERIASVVATTPVTLLRLGKDAYTRYLTHAAEVEQEITRTAMGRTFETTRKMIAASERDA